MIEVLRDIDGLYKVSINPYTRKFESYSPISAFVKMFGSEEELNNAIPKTSYSLRSLYEEKPERIVPPVSDEYLKKRAPALFKKEFKESLTEDTLNNLKEKMFNKGISRLLKAYKKATETDSDFVAGISDVLCFMFPDKKKEIEGYLK